ncbi:thioredoxin domain-containing protein [Georgenia faecalis]|uniref:thioredoxin domain-containing protein n=1 Tax=Georgenia faecalis TaxID=2483799 RepID=UPI000FD6BA52|nr:thioredoxin domain-containing protein [Georgenia faecalis]
MTNRLADATSPYLLQHKDNPVDWYEWGEEAFAEAKRRDVPLLVSVGYAACHWCHVMAHESFEDPAVAAVMNEQFVNVKVDREERPDVDAVYMSATQAMTGHGGWPMTVFATPEGEPFFCGTYFPPRPVQGMPAFPQVLEAVDRAWRENNEGVLSSARDISAHVAGMSGRGLSSAGLALDENTTARALSALQSSYDADRGGFGGAPKFPPSMLCEWLLRRGARTGDARTLDWAASTLDAMARGGMYDQLAGGFARYSVDADWVVPHFEKMLYDNALLLRVYLHWWRQTGAPLGRTVATETAEWLLAELRTPEGAFASSLDADSDGEEGAFYVWTPDQIRAELGDEDGAWAAHLWGVTDTGTFEHGRSVLQLREDPDDAERYALVRATLHAARERRNRPGLDDKVVAAWNGLVIAALAEAGALLDRPEWVRAAEEAADLVLSLHDAGGRLVRTSRNGVAGTSAAVLEDYANMAEGLLALYAVTGTERHALAAGRLLDVVLDHFGGEDGAFYDTSDDETDAVLARIHRPRDPADGPTPSGHAAAAGALLTYGALMGSLRHTEAAQAALDHVAPIAMAYPRAAGWALAVAEAALDGPREVAIVGPADDPGTHQLHLTALRSSAPGLVIALGDGSAAGADGDTSSQDVSAGTSRQQVSLLEGRPLVDGKPTAYVCRGFVCELPTTDPEALAGQL